ncbi:MAG TPA: trigger factor [Chthoniobacteraceae bacterium]|nr:trigger factor [Chthoniobacteraceae bacterium]
MNVQLENLPSCITSMRVELPADAVTPVRDAIIREYTQYARLPGYRPGKAPRIVVEAKFKKEIKEELEKRLVSDAVRNTIKEHSLRVLSVSNVDDVEYGDDKGVSFTATLVTAPAFELPGYKGIAVEVPPSEVTETEVDASIERLREQAAEFSDVTDRAVELEDFAVIDYQGTIDGTPIDEAVPSAGAQLAKGSDFWIKLSPDAFLPGFSDKVAGLAIGESREFDIELPADLPLADLAGKTLHYTVTLKAIKQRDLPELNDEFARTIVPEKSLEELRDLARTELNRQRELEVEREKRNSILTQILAKVECELPESFVRNETHRVLTQLIEDNQRRGVPDEVLTANQKELLTSATSTARERLKGTFVLLRIAEAENITVSREEFDRQIARIAAGRNQPEEKVRKEFEKGGLLDRIHEDILSGKTLDFLVSAASVSVVAPSENAADAAEKPTETPADQAAPAVETAPAEAPEA